VADAVLIPVQPSPYDIWAAADLVDLIKARQEVTDGKPQAAFLISRAIKRTVLGREILAALAEYGLPVFASGTVQRQSYPRSAAEGRTVLEDGSKEAAEEINAIADELLANFGSGDARHGA
jgi:chromosome partitioning protein